MKSKAKTFTLFLTVIFVLAIVSGALAVETKKVKWGYWPGTTQCTLFVAFEKGYFKELGLDVEPVPFKVGADQAVAYMAGQIDVYSMNPTSVINVRAKGTPSKIVASLAKNGSYLVTRKGFTVQSAKDLYGKKIAVPAKGNVQDILLRFGLIYGGVDPFKYEVSTFTYNDTAAVLEKQTFDAVFSSEPMITRAERSGAVGQVIPEATLGIEGHQCCVVAMKEDFIKNNPELVKKMVLAIDKATEFFNDPKNAEESNKIVAKYTGADPEILKSAIKRHIFVPRIDYAAANWFVTYVAMMRRLGYIDKNLTAQDLIATEFMYNGFYNKNWNPPAKITKALGVKLPYAVK